MKKHCKEGKREHKIIFGLRSGLKRARQSISEGGRLSKNSILSCFIVEQ